MSRQFTIGQKGLLIVSIPLAFEAIFALLLLFLLQQMNGEIEHEEKTRDVLSTTHHFGRMVLDASALIAAISIHPLTGMQARVDEMLREAAADLARLKLLLASDQSELQVVDKMENSLTVAKSILDTTDHKMNESDSLFLIYTNPALRKSGKSISQMNSSVQQLVVNEEKHSRQNLERVESSKKAIEAALLLGLLVSVGSTVWLTVFYSRNISQRIHALQKNATSLGSRQPLALTISGDDEISDLDAALRRTNQDLTQLETARRNLVAFVGHELRTPLTALSSIFSLLAADAFMPLDERAKTITRETNIELKEVNDLIGDLIDIEKMEGGKFLLLLSDVDVPTLVDMVLEKCGGDDSQIYERVAAPGTKGAQVAKVAQVAQGAKVGFRVVRVEDVLITADRDRLCRVLVNLVRSAMKRSACGATVEIQATVDAGWIDFKVTGTGRPIEKYLRRCIFDRNQFTDESDSLNTYISEALPLIISRMIIEEHRGVFDIRSDGKQRTTFLCRLPLEVAGGETTENDSRKN